NPLMGFDNEISGQFSPLTEPGLASTQRRRIVLTRTFPMAEVHSFSRNAFNICDGRVAAMSSQTLRKPMKSLLSGYDDSQGCHPIPSTVGRQRPESAHHRRPRSAGFRERYR